jgi:hypothetical protein
MLRFVRAVRKVIAHMSVAFWGDRRSTVLQREQIQAGAFLTGATVSERDFTRSVGAFGYPAAVLLDQHGRILQIAPRRPELLGTDLTGRYAHLRTAVGEGRPAVSRVVPSAARGEPVAAFAVFRFSRLPAGTAHNFF